ncbi:MAG: hypothetical protein J6U20_13080 [Fibrobacter sp.]|nr:hypothetical protein [Fibrobacter sp.]
MKQKIVWLGGLFIAGALCACATAPRWYKPGVSQYETENAIAQCEYEKGKDHVEQGDFVTNCMKRQGFRWSSKY